MTLSQLERSRVAESAFTVTWTRSAIDDANAPPPMTWHAAFDGENFWESWRTPTEIAVLAWNTEYDFRVAKASAAGAWTTRELIVGRDSPDQVAQRARANEIFRDPHLRVDSLLLKDLIVRHRERTSIREVDSDGMSGVEVQITPNSAETNRFFPDGIDHITAVVAFDPCYVLSYDLSNETRNLTGRNIDFEIAEDGDIAFVRYEHDDYRSDPAGPMISDSMYEYKIQPGEKHGEAKYRLSDYGLPEPLALKPPGSYRTSPWLYYFFGGVLCVAVGAFFAYRAVRRKA